MANMIDQYINVKDESTYGTAVAATRSIDFTSEDVKAKNSDVVMASGLRAGEFLVNAKRVKRNPKGASGSLEFQVANYGFAFWAKHMFGNLTTGATTQGVTTHTATIGDTRGKSFTLQKVQFGADSTLYPKTYQGGKVVSWEISNGVNDFLKAKLDLDFQKETLGAGAGAFAAQAKNFGTYTDFYKDFFWNEGQLTIGGTQVDIMDISIKGKKNVADDRYFIKPGGLKAEPIQNGLDEVTVDMKLEYRDLVQELRVASALESGAQASLVATWTAPEPEPAGGVASITFSIPVVSFVDAGTSIDVSKLAEQTLSGNVLWPGSGQGTNGMTVTIVTPDATAV